MLSLALSMLFTEKQSYLTNQDLLCETRNVRSCGNLSLIQFRWCCIYLKWISVGRGFKEESTKWIKEWWGTLPSWVRPKRRTKRRDAAYRAGYGKYKSNCACWDVKGGHSQVWCNHGGGSSLRGIPSWKRKDAKHLTAKNQPTDW